MPYPTEDREQMTAAIAALTEALQGFEARYAAARRAERRLRLGLFLATLLILGGTVYFTLAATTGFLDRILPPRLVQFDPGAAQQRRERLLASLSVEERARIEQFEKQLGLVREYVQVSPDFDAAATVALVLSQMGRSVEVMPQIYQVVVAMHDDMRAINVSMAEMNRKLDTLPVLTTEIQAMRGQMAVMAAGVDSTMGRAGRMMPWNW